MLLVAEHGLAGATVDARTSPMGDGLASYHQGVISARNVLAAAAGVEIGQPAREAAQFLVDRQPPSMSPRTPD
jgi:hypothetical protein